MNNSEIINKIESSRDVALGQFYGSIAKTGENIKEII